MQDIAEELLVPPSPYVALIGDASFIDILAVALKTCSSPGSGAVHVRYEPVSPPLRFTPKARTHTDAEYATYVPEGILRRAWMERHHNSVPSVMVRTGAQSRAHVSARARFRACGTR